MVDAVSLMLPDRTKFSWVGNSRRDPRWLFLQTENSCRRLQFDLKRMLTAFTSEECESIKDGVSLHTLEGDEDGFLMLDLEIQSASRRRLPILALI